MDRKVSRKIWLGITAVIFVYTAVLTVEHRIGRLEDQQEMFRQRIEQDSTMLERLKYDEYLEQYAREKFHMQRSDEHVYIMED